MKKYNCKSLLFLTVAVVLPLSIVSTAVFVSSRTKDNNSLQIEMRSKEDEEIIKRLTNEKIALQNMLSDTNNPTIAIAGVVNDILDTYYDSSISLADKYGRIKTKMNEGAVDILFPLTDPDVNIEDFTESGSGNSIISDMQIYTNIIDPATASAAALFDYKTTINGDTVNSKVLFSCTLSLNNDGQWIIDQIENNCFFKEE